MKREIQLAAWAAAGVMVSAMTAGAASVGTDNFTYPDGSIADRAGGTGWAFKQYPEAGAPASAPSDWDAAGGAANVAAGKLVTLGGGAFREYNGPSEKVAVPSNEREGAFQGKGQVFYAVDLVRQAGADWSGVSSFDFDAERIFFGVPSGQGANAFFGIEETGVANNRNMTTVPVVAGQTYRVVAEIDYEADKLNLWIDPSAGDALSPDATRAYASTNWSSKLRLASGGTGSTSWDNLAVGTTFADVVPEPTTAVWLAGIGALALLRRRR
jgi:MYXO-CTERM domain-containing protein